MAHIIMAVLRMGLPKDKAGLSIKLVVSTKGKFDITLPKAKEYLSTMSKNTNTWGHG